jgi:uncharacterized protein DUF4382
MRSGVLGMLPLVAIVSASACGVGSTGTSTGTVSANIADAPFPIDSITSVDVFVVSLQTTTREVSDDEIRDVAAATGWQTISTPNQSYNLLELRGGKTASLGEARIPTGIYRRFRLVLDTDKSSVTLKGGKVLTGTSTPGIRWPSAGQSGVKVEMAGTLALTEAGATLLVDVNLEASFVLAGNTISAGGLIFKPVVRAQRTN